MVKYTCQRCCKEFTQKSHYNSHKNRKTLCQNNADKIKELVQNELEKIKLKFEKNDNYLSNMTDKKLLVDETLIQHTDSDIFTPQEISKKMSSYLLNNGSLLEPAVGEGNLLTFLNLKDYSEIDIYDIKKKYLDKCPELDNLNKYHEDFLKTNLDKKYKNIIFNPPYIKFQDLSDDYRIFLKEKWNLLKSGNIDIYYAFILKCLEILDDDGIMVSITPNSYLYNNCAYHLRKYLFKNNYIQEIIDYKSKKVFSNVSVYCCITVFTKSKKHNLIYNNVKKSYEDIINNDYNIFYSSKVKNSKKSLKNICNIKNGIATLRDKIFIHNTKKYDESCWKPIIKSGTKKMWAIFPYQNGKITPEDIFKQNNPKTYEYLLKNKDELSKRDKGKKKYASWYAYGRTQSIIVSDNKECIYIPTFCDPNKMKITKGENILHISTIKIELLDINYTLDDIIDILKDNHEYIVENCPKRGGGWINLTTRILNSIRI